MRRSSCTLRLALAISVASVTATRAARAEPGPAPPTAAPPASSSQASDAQLTQLREIVEAQQRAIADLEARVARAEQSRAQAPPPPPDLPASAPPPTAPVRATPATATATMWHDIALSGYLHLDWVPYRQSSQDEVNPTTSAPLNEDRFVVRRARLRADSDQGLIHAAFMIDANTINGPQLRPWNAEASLKWPPETPYQRPSAIAQTTSKSGFVIVSTGLLITPFGFDVTELENERPFLERPTMSNELIPQSYDLGLRIMGGYKVLNYAFAIVNGDPIGESTFPGRDPNKSKDLVFRIGTSSEVVPGLRVDAGVSGLNGRGFHQGNPPTKDQLVWRDQNENGIVEQTELQVIPGSPATPSEGFQRFALGADLRLHVQVPLLGELVLRGEIVRAKNLDRGTFAADPIAASRDLREIGWYVGGAQELTRWGMIAVRYDTFNPDTDATDQRSYALVPKDSSLSTWSFMGAVRYRQARLIAQYDHRENALGRDVSGAPTMLQDDSFTLRAVVGF